MAATSHPLTALDWSDCGAADDCGVELLGRAADALVTTAANKPAADAAGLLLSRDGVRSASFQKAGLKVWARGLHGATTVVVER